MVKITNGIDTFEVTKGAYKTVFKAQGYRVLDQSETPAHIASEPGVQDPEKTEDEKFVDEIIEKPIAQWTKEELKRFADINEISLEGVSKVDEVREIIASYIG